MSFAVIHTRAVIGVNAVPVAVEVHLANGLPNFSLVGLAETAVKESKDRVRGALITSNFEFPVRRITVNLAPADLPKEGGRFDLPVAVGILVASGQLSCAAIHCYELSGELGLGGILRPVRGVLPVSLAAVRAGRALVVPAESADEAMLVSGAEVYPACHLLEVTAHLSGAQPLSRAAGAGGEDPIDYPDLAEVRGQAPAKRALEIAAAGGHSLLMVGPPGSGKTMLAMRLPGILPPMSEHEALQSAAVRSVAGDEIRPTAWRARPLRSPHHSASSVALVGGGTRPRPGEISLAHNGVLFLDELPEFERRVLEQLREPLESGVIHISRAAQRVCFPAAFQLIAAMNPCPCGWLGDPSGRCRCSSEQVQRYRHKVSGPLLDRIDMHVEVPAVARGVLHGRQSVAEPSEPVRARVTAARRRQIDRQGTLNNVLHGGMLERFCMLDSASQALLDAATDRLGLSARSYHRILRLARTITDTAGRDAIESDHIAEAVHLRCLDRSR